MTSDSSDKRNAGHGRQKARRLAMQALYQWQIAGQNLRDIEKQFLDEQDIGGADVEYFIELLHGVPKNLEEIDHALAPALTRPLKDVDPVERAILRMSVYELIYRLDIPYRVVINESVRLAKGYGAVHAHKFVNAAIDKVAKDVRRIEISAGK